VPTAFSFLCRFRKAAAAAAGAPAEAPRVGQLAEFLIELALVDHGMLKHPLSLVAAAALHASLAAAGADDAYPRALRRHTRYDLAEVLPVARELLALAGKAGGGSLKAVFKKYSSGKFGEVALMELPDLGPDEPAAA
jgi:hypothetical protein